MRTGPGDGNVLTIETPIVSLSYKLPRSPFLLFFMIIPCSFSLTSVFVDDHSCSLTKGKAKELYKVDSNLPELEKNTKQRYIYGSGS